MLEYYYLIFLQQKYIGHSNYFKIQCLFVFVTKLRKCAQHAIYGAHYIICVSKTGHINAGVPIFLKKIHYFICPTYYYICICYMYFIILKLELSF